MKEKQDWSEISHEEWYKLNPSDLYVEFKNVPLTHQNHLWSQIEEEDKRYIISGYQITNAIGYYITEHPWDVESIILL